MRLCPCSAGLAYVLAVPVRRDCGRAAVPHRAQTECQVNPDRTVRKRGREKYLGIWSVFRIRSNDLFHRWSVHSGSGGRPSRFLWAAFSRRIFSMCSTYFLADRRHQLFLQWLPATGQKGFRYHGRLTLLDPMDAAVTSAEPGSLHDYPGAANPASHPNPERIHNPHPFLHGLRATECPASTRCPIETSRNVPRMRRRHPWLSGRTSRIEFLRRDAAVTAHLFGYSDQRTMIMRSSRRRFDGLPDPEAVRGVTRKHLHRP